MKQAANAAQSLLFSVLLINKERRIKLACLPKLQRISKKMTKASSRKSEDGRSKDEISIRCNSKVFFFTSVYFFFECRLKTKQEQSRRWSQKSAPISDRKESAQRVIPPNCKSFNTTNLVEVRDMIMLLL